MKVGFTGTRNGMSQPQWRTVKDVLARLGTKEFHHGDCVGADDEAHELAGRLNAVRVVHPPVDNAHRAGVMFYDQMREPKTHFARNRDIVNETDVLVAAPFTMTEQDRGGTWYTVGYARKRGKPVVIVWPDGSEVAERRAVLEPVIPEAHS